MTTYHKILVTLDGSDLARQALPHAVEVATQHKATLVLIQVVPGLEQVVWVEYSSPMAMNMAPLEEALRASIETTNAELNRIAATLGGGKLTTETVVEVGYASDKIAEYAREHKVDLIVMSTHGRTGISRMIYGSVAGRVLSERTCPILFVPARSVEQTEAVMEAEQILDLA